MPEIDALLVELREHRERATKKRDSDITTSFWNGFPYSKKHVLEVKAFWDAKIGLVDGVMAVIRQYNLSSESLVRETSDYDIPAMFRLDNPRERRNSI